MDRVRRSRRRAGDCVSSGARIHPIRRVRWARRLRTCSRSFVALPAPICDARRVGLGTGGGGPNRWSVEQIGQTQANPPDTTSSVLSRKSASCTVHQAPYAAALEITLENVEEVPDRVIDAVNSRHARCDYPCAPLAGRGVDGSSLTRPHRRNSTASSTTLTSRLFHAPSVVTRQATSRALERSGSVLPPRVFPVSSSSHSPQRRRATQFCPSGLPTSASAPVRAV